MTESITLQLLQFKKRAYYTLNIFYNLLIYR